jgi:hypothetical protein
MFLAGCSRTHTRPMEPWRQPTSRHQSLLHRSSRRSRRPRNSRSRPLPRRHRPRPRHHQLHPLLPRLFQLSPSHWQHHQLPSTHYQQMGGHSRRKGNPLTRPRPRHSKSSTFRSSPPTQAYAREQLYTPPQPIFRDFPPPAVRNSVNQEMFREQPPFFREPPQFRQTTGPPPRPRTAGEWDNSTGWGTNKEWNTVGNTAWGQNQFREGTQETLPQIGWRNIGPHNGPPRGRGGGGREGPIRSNPRSQPVRSNQPNGTNAMAQKPYERPKPALRQSSMPSYFTTVEGSLHSYASMPPRTSSARTRPATSPTNQGAVGSAPCSIMPKSDARSTHATWDMKRPETHSKRQRHLADVSAWQSTKRAFSKTIQPQQQKTQRQRHPFPKPWRNSKTKHASPKTLQRKPQTPPPCTSKNWSRTTSPSDSRTK